MSVVLISSLVGLVATAFHLAILNLPNEEGYLHAVDHSGFLIERRIWGWPSLASLLLLCRHRERLLSVATALHLATSNCLFRQEVVITVNCSSL